MMTHPSKRKGNSFERELVNIAKASGIESKRAYASNGESLGLHPEVDCLVGGYKIQAKRRKVLASWLYPSNKVDVVAARPDGGEALVILTYSDWLDLVKKAENSLDKG